MQRIEADLLIPGVGEPVKDGVVVLDGDRIAYAGPASDAPAGGDASCPIGGAEAQLAGASNDVLAGLLDGADNERVRLGQALQALQEHAQRLYRETAFLLVFGSRTAIKASLLGRLGAT